MDDLHLDLLDFRFSFQLFLTTKLDLYGQDRHSVVLDIMMVVTSTTKPQGQRRHEIKHTQPL